MLPKSYVFYVVPLFAVFIIAEIIIYRRRQLKFPWAEAFVSAFIGLTYVLSNAMFSNASHAINNFFERFRLFDISVNTIGSAVALFFLLEFIYYWEHRFAHRIRWMWANHSTHHSPCYMTLSNSIRISSTSFFSGAILFPIPLLVIGFSFQDVSMMFGINLLFQFFLHTDVIPKLGFLEYVFNTPSHHRVHHGTNEGYLDKNFGGVLIIFDRMFGTFAEEDLTKEIKYGLVGREQTYNPITLTFQEWASVAKDVLAARNWKERFLFAFGPPEARLTLARIGEEALLISMPQDTSGDERKVV